MSIALDGFKVLHRLGEAPEAFRSVRTDVDKAARTLVVKCLKTKTTDLRAMRAIYAALDGQQFELVIEGLKDTELKSLVLKLDKHRPDAKTMSSQERRRHLLALASGTAEPSLPSTKPAKGKTAPVKKVTKGEPPKRLQSDVMDLFRARGKMRDDD